MRKNLSPSTGDSQQRFSTARDFGPCSDSAAIWSVRSVIVTSMPTAFMCSQRSEGSAEVRRKLVLAEARHRAVVEQLALVVAPARVVDLPDRELRDVARHDAVEQPRGVRALDQVLHQRRDVDQRRVIADRPVLALEPEVVGADRDVARPAAPVLRQAQRGRARVEGRALELVEVGHWISRAAPRPSGRRAAGGGTTAPPPRGERTGGPYRRRASAGRVARSGRCPRPRPARGWRCRWRRG